jgi:type VI secretion system secreted protein VgrG
MKTLNQLGNMERRFSFKSDGDPQTQFEVVSFEGEEALAALYRFEIILASSNADVDESKLINYNAHFSLNDGVRGGSATEYIGLVQSFEQLHQSSGWTHYRAVLVPKLWQLDTYILSQVYQEKTRPDVFKIILENAGLSVDDYSMQLVDENGRYARRGYICQYKESYLNFIARWSEHMGIYWWYETKNGREIVVFADNRRAHRDSALPLRYQPAGELDADVAKIRRIQSFVLHTQSLPRTLTVMDYAHQTPSLKISASADVDPNGIGEVTQYGAHLRSNEEAQHFAALRAEELLCRGRQFIGQSTATGIRCGEFVNVSGHYRNSFNRRYLITLVRHRGSQAGLLLESCGLPHSDGERASDFYHAEFNCIPSDTQFRPEIKHAWPKIEGTLNAFIDAEGSGQYAELNEHGEYKIQVPFNKRPNDPDKGSAWVRMITPYAGTDHGMHFPLHKGAEVLLSFVNGNPDQPVIMGAVPNTKTPSVIVNATQTQSRIRTAGGNQLALEDHQGSQRILLNSPVKNTYLSMGAAHGSMLPVQPATVDANIDAQVQDDVNAMSQDGFYVNTGGSFGINAGSNWNVKVYGISNQTTVGLSTLEFIGGQVYLNLADYNAFYVGLYTQLNLGVTSTISIAGSWDYKMSHGRLVSSEIAFKGDVMHVVANKLSAIEDEINATNMRIDTTETCIEQTNDAIQTHANLINATETNLRQITTRLTNAETDLLNHGTVIGEFDTDIKNIQASIEEVETRISSTSTTVEQVGTRVSQVESAVEEQGVLLQSGTLILIS